MTETRYTLVARTLDKVETLFVDQTVSPAHQGQTWLEIDCGRCHAKFQIAARSLNKIIVRYGYIYCANAGCGERLHAMTQSEVSDLLSARTNN